MDDLLLGPSIGLGVVNGRTVTGSASVRQYRHAYLANNDVGDFAEF
jgi:hypothetical protein